MGGLINDEAAASQYDISNDHMLNDMNFEVTLERLKYPKSTSNINSVDLENIEGGSLSSIGHEAKDTTAVEADD